MSACPAATRAASFRAESLSCFTSFLRFSSCRSLQSTSSIMLSTTDFPLHNLDVHSLSFPLLANQIMGSATMLRKSVFFRGYMREKAVCIVVKTSMNVRTCVDLECESCTVYMLSAVSHSWNFRTASSSSVISTPELFFCPRPSRALVRHF